MTINYFENEILSKLTDSGWSLSNKFGSDVDYYTNEFKSDEIWHLQSKTINRGFHLFLHFYNYVGSRPVVARKLHFSRSKNIQLP